MDRERASASPGADTVIEVENLARRFGEIEAVRGVSFRVHRREIFGLLGPNGAGKSTLMRMLCGILTPTGGRGRVAGFDIEREPERIKLHIGYMAQRFGLYEDLSVIENLRFYAGVYGIERARQREAIEAALERGGLEGRRTQLVATLSGGWKQRLALACATVHEPPLLFLDEPTAGVDPVSRREFWARIHAIASAGSAVVVTTHYMDEAARCHRIAFIFSGRLLDIGPPAEVVARRGLRAAWLTVRETERAIEILKRSPGVDDVAPFGARIRLVCREVDPVQVARSALTAVGIRILHSSEDAPSVEDAFVSLLHADAAGRESSE
ncbi:MAG: ABC transporter ATP-binding protein [Deltaproteobacteria bacterium]|nr:MAG: ABC transporter ATP-binding protein [Deltaproteobacteria bacterium]